MENKVECKPYTIDWQKIVLNTKEMLFYKVEELEKALATETNPLKYIELKAVLENAKAITKKIDDMHGYCHKVVE